MLYREIIAVCSQIHTKHTNTLCGQSVGLVNVKLAGKYSNHWALKNFACRHLACVHFWFLYKSVQHSPDTTDNLCDSADTISLSVNKFTLFTTNSYIFGLRRIYLPINKLCWLHKKILSCFPVSKRKGLHYSETPSHYYLTLRLLMSYMYIWSAYSWCF